MENYNKGKLQNTEQNTAVSSTETLCSHKISHQDIKQYQVILHSERLIIPALNKKDQNSRSQDKRKIGGEQAV